MKALVLLLALAATAAGCAIPDNRPTTFQVEGVLVDEDGAPLPGAHIDILLPGTHGLPRVSPRDQQLMAVPRRQLNPVVTDEEGRFHVEFNPFSYAFAYWVFPPLWDSFQGPPWPVLAVRVEKGDESLWLRFTDVGVHAFRFWMIDSTPIEGEGPYRASGRAEACPIVLPDGSSIEGYRVRLRLERTRRP